MAEQAVEMNGEKWISAERAEEVIQIADEAGLVHMTLYAPKDRPYGKSWGQNLGVTKSWGQTLCLAQNLGVRPCVLHILPLQFSNKILGSDLVSCISCPFSSPKGISSGKIQVPELEGRGIG